MFLIRPRHFSSNGPYPTHLTRHFSTLPHPDGSGLYLKQKKKMVPEIFQEIISFLIPFLESTLLSGIIWWTSTLSQIVVSLWRLDASTWLILQQKTTPLCVFMDKRHCNCISSRPANELFNHLHMGRVLTSRRRGSSGGKPWCADCAVLCTPECIILPHKR